jgi:hypothetical protein
VIAPGARVARAWIWRFLCRDCGRTCSVRPDDVLARRRYTLAAIVIAWVLAVRRPVGDEHPDEAVYALVGVDRRLPGPEGHRSGRWRWRSLSRWSLAIEAWWPTRRVVGTTWRERADALLTGFIPGEGGRTRAVWRALDAHAAGGRAM